ncbi:hypothetical protein BDV97DRAFT_371569 [Delphinella strobiligena]|nr:hypothetical protein BDV97DRAFT_371569 [Delphinella strobiligena]
MFKLVYICLSFAALFVQVSIQQFNPLTDFCRRFAHQTTIIDRKLYIDGGLVNYGGSLQSDPTNYTNTWLLYADLDVLYMSFPQEYDNLTKNATVPSVQGGVLWADTVNKLFYVYGGEYPSGSTAEPFTLWVYDVIYDQWNETTTDTSGIVRTSFGAGVAVDTTAFGYYYGGWMSNASIPNWSSEPIATSGFLLYDMNSGVFTNTSGPDLTPRAEGVLLYIPASDNGMLVYFGGIQTPFGAGNNSWTGVPMSEIYLYDIASGKWYQQSATGDVPDMRRRFCAGATWASDQSSYNIYLYGGLSMPPNTMGFDDVYILTIPSFTWIKWYPSTNGTGTSPHHSLSCNVIDGSQMIIMGGTFPNSSNIQCDAKQIYGQHNLNLGQQDPQDAEWFVFLPNVTSYQVPATINSVISGSATGAASLTTPTQGWGHQDLPVYFTRRAPSTTRTATRYIPPTATSTSTAQNTTTPTNNTTATHKTDAGAIAGGTVGGVCAIAFAILLAYLCLRRHKKQPPPQPPHELAPGRPTTPMGELETSQPWPQPHSSSYPKSSPLSTRATTASSPYSPETEGNRNISHLPFASSELGWHQQSPQTPHQHQAPLQYFPPPPQAQPYFPPPMPAEVDARVHEVGVGVEQQSQSHELPNVRSPANVYERDKRRLEPVVSREDIGVDGGEGGGGGGGRREGVGESPAVSVAEE